MTRIIIIELAFGVNAWPKEMVPLVAPVSKQGSIIRLSETVELELVLFVKTKVSSSAILVVGPHTYTPPGVFTVIFIESSNDSPVKLFAAIS